MINKHVNTNRKKVSLKNLKKELVKLTNELDEQRKADNRAVSDALRSGFYCTGGRSNIKPLI